MRFDLAKEREGGTAGGGLVLGRGRGESIGMEAVDVVESDVGADVVEGGGHDSLELCHVECVTATGGRHVEERLSLSLLSSSLNTDSSQIPISTPFRLSSYPNRGTHIGDPPSVPSRSSHYFIYPFMPSSLCWVRSPLSSMIICYCISRGPHFRYALNLSHSDSHGAHSSEKSQILIL